MEINIIRVKDKLPDADGIFLAAHDFGDHLEGKIAWYFQTDKTWAAVAQGTIKTLKGEDAYLIEDITDWVDRWAAIPDEMWSAEED